MKRYIYKLFFVGLVFVLCECTDKDVVRLTESALTPASQFGEYMNEDDVADTVSGAVSEHGSAPLVQCYKQSQIPYHLCHIMCPTCEGGGNITEIDLIDNLKSGAHGHLFNIFRESALEAAVEYVRNVKSMFAARLNIANENFCPLSESGCNTPCLSLSFFINKIRGQYHIFPGDDIDVFDPRMDPYPLRAQVRCIQSE